MLRWMSRNNDGKARGNSQRAPSYNQASHIKERLTDQKLKWWLDQELDIVSMKSEQLIHIIESQMEFWNMLKTVGVCSCVPPVQTWRYLWKAQVFLNTRLDFALKKNSFCEWTALVTYEACDGQTRRVLSTPTSRWSWPQRPCVGL